MKNTPLKRKTPLKRHQAIKRGKGPSAGNFGRLSAHSKSDTAVLKRRIQELVREVVIKRDGGCIFSALSKLLHLGGLEGLPPCNGYRKDGQLILQADHLITRANSVTYADTRLIVCVCKGHHGWKKWHKKEYEHMVRCLLSPERVKLWDQCEEDSWRPHRKYQSDWKKEIASLEQEYREL